MANDEKNLGNTPAPQPHTMGDIEARSVLWNFAINACAALIEKNIIMDTSAGKVLAPRQDGNREGLHYATAIRGLTATTTTQDRLPPEPRVKPLLWKKMNDDGTRWASEATICGIFYICFHSDKGWFSFMKEWAGQFAPSLDEAKTAAQSEFKRLIMSALAATEGKPNA